MSDKLPVVNQPIIDLYDEYTHAPLDRRDFVKRLAALVGSSAAAYALLPVLENNYAHAALVAEDDARITSRLIEIDGPAGKLKAYLAQPAGKPKSTPRNERFGKDAPRQNVPTRGPRATEAEAPPPRRGAGRGAKPGSRPEFPPAGNGRRVRGEGKPKK